MNAVARRLAPRPLQVLVAGLVLAAGLACVPAVQAQEATDGVQAAAVTARAPLDFRIVIQDAIRVKQGDFDAATAGRAAWRPKVIQRRDVVEGRTLVTLAQP